MTVDGGQRRHQEGPGPGPGLLHNHLLQGYMQKHVHLTAGTQRSLMRSPYLEVLFWSSLPEPSGHRGMVDHNPQL